MCPLKYYQIMRDCSNKKQYRYQMVVYAREKGIKPTARLFNTSPQVVRKWLARYKEENYAGLGDRSRRPLRMPNATPEAEKRHIVACGRKYGRMGAEPVKALEGLGRSPKTIRKIWREAGVGRRRRRKKYKTKQNLREVKKRYKLFEKACEDTKDLFDIPEYYWDMRSKGLPRVQYTYREVSCGITFMGFADERSLTHATLFAAYVNEHLERYDLLPEASVRQTDNGSEYIGSWNAKRSSSYTREVERLPGQVHRTIFPGAKTCQSDVETVHNLIEQELLEIERFEDRENFFRKTHTYQQFFNFLRPNSYKENKTPWQLTKEKRPGLNRLALMLPVIDLDRALKNIDVRGRGGNYVLSNPSFQGISSLQRTRGAYNIEG